MSAINFVVRDGAGNIHNGAIGGTTGVTAISATSGQDISLNLDRSHILSYMRSGQALQVTLVDGQIITIDGFFSASGVAQSDLYISGSSQLSEVQLVTGEGNLLYAQYADSDAFGKWSPDDALYFTDDATLAIANVETVGNGVEAAMLGVPVLAGLGGLAPAGLAAAAGLGGALLLGGSDGGGATGRGVSSVRGGDPKPDPEPDSDTASDPETPVVDITAGVKASDDVVNAEDHADGVDVGGTGTPGAAGIVTIKGVSKDVIADDQGNWTATFAPDEIPTGEYETSVSVTLTNEGGSATATGELVVDTVASVTLDTSSVEGDGIVSEVEESDGFTLTGTTQAGSSVDVVFGGSSYVATVVGDTWTLDVPAGTVAHGEYDLDIKVTATDEHGNSASASDTLRIDTETSVTLDTSAAGGDGTVNEAEHVDGVTVNGVAESNATVVVTLGAVSQAVNAGADGSWSATFASVDVPTGTLELPVTAVSTDAAGNTATASGAVQIDTELDVSVDTASVETDGIVNAVEHADGVTLNGTSDAGATVQVAFGSGVHTVIAGSDGNWSAEFTSNEVPTGELFAPVSVSATDAAGNTASASGTVKIDTYVNRLEGVDTVEGDNVVNNAEASDGITLNGVVEAGSAVMVTFEGTTRAATVDGSGNWSVDFAANEIPSGEYNATVVISATDAAGNTSEISDTFLVDTLAPDAPNIESYTEGHDGVRGIGIEDTTDDITLHEYVEGRDDAATAVTAADGTFVNPGTGELNFAFDGGHAVPDGSHLVVTASDASDNANSTLFVLDDTAGSTVDVTTVALDAFNIGAIDLEFAEESELTLTIADIEAMSANDNTLVIHGGSDDIVALNGAATADGTATIHGKGYDVYTIGDDGGRLIIGEDIDFTQNVV